MTNKLKIWENPFIKNLKGEFFVDQITDDKEGLRIMLSNTEDFKILIKWDMEGNDCVITYRNSYESYFSFGGYNTNDDSLLGKQFYIIENSKFINQVKEWAYPDVIESTGRLIHFAIYTAEDCIDIIATCEPIFERL